MAEHRTESMTESKHPLVDMAHAIIAAIQKKSPKPLVELHDDSIFFQVDGHDQGRFVGKQGRVIWSIQTLFWYAGVADRRQPVSAVLMEPKVPATKVRMPYKADPKWNRNAVRDLVDKVLQTCFPMFAVPFVLEEHTETKATLRVRMNSYMKMNLSEPSFEEALATLVHAAGMGHGASIQTEIEWF